MIARSSVLGLVLLAAAVIETALFPTLSLIAVRPDLLVLVTTAVALRDGSLAGMRVGASAGLLADLLVSQPPVGLSVLVLSVIGYAVGVARPYLAPDSWTAPILLAFTTGVLATASVGTLALLLGDDRVSWVLLVQVALTVGLTNLLLAPVVVRVITRLTTTFPLTATAADER